MKGEGRSFLDVFGEVFSSDAGLGVTALIEEVGTKVVGTLSNKGEEVGGGVESAMDTGVEPIFKEGGSSSGEIRRRRNAYGLFSGVS